MIGIFDSGVGGLTVAREMKKKLPEKPIIYFGDTARVPWGNKSPEVVRGYCEQICDFLLSKGATEIIIACNTASAFAAQYLREKYPQVQIYDVIDPVVEKVVKESGDGKDRIGVIGTRGTIASGVYEKKIREKNSELEVFSKACPLFVPMVEEGWTDEVVVRMVVEGYLEYLKKKGISKIILGCTHYPLLKNVISDFLGADVQCIGSDEEVVNSLSGEKEILAESCSGEDRFYFSDLSLDYLQLAGNIYGSEIKAEKIDLS